ARPAGNRLDLHRGAEDLSEPAGRPGHRPHQIVRAPSRSPVEPCDDARALETLPARPRYFLTPTFLRCSSIASWSPTASASRSSHWKIGPEIPYSLRSFHSHTA